MFIYIFAIMIFIVVVAMYMIKPPSNWVPTVGKIGKDGRKVYLGHGKWQDVYTTQDGKYLNPITNKFEFIPGIISADKTTVYTGTSWIPVTLSPDGKWYLNPITHTYAPVKRTRRDAVDGRDWKWDLFNSSWR